MPSFEAPRVRVVLEQFRDAVGQALGLDGRPASMRPEATIRPSTGLFTQPGAAGILGPQPRPSAAG